MLSGMVNLMLDTSGRLVFFQALPAEVDDTPAPVKPMDWNPLFTAAGLATCKISVDRSAMDLASQLR